LNDPGKFKAPFIPKERIWQETEKLRAAHPAGRAMPVQVLELAEPGEPCRKCSTPVIKQTSRKKPKHDFTTSIISGVQNAKPPTRLKPPNGSLNSLHLCFNLK